MQYSKVLSQSGVNFDTEQWCVTVADWFHGHGVVAWSGTPSELGGELLSAGVMGEGHSLDDSNELIAKLEANSDSLRELGVDVGVLRARDRVRSVSLRANGAKPATLTEEVRSNSCCDEGDELAHGSDCVELSESEAGVGEIASDPASRVMELGIPEWDTGNEFAALESVGENEGSALPMGVAALIALVALGLILGFAVSRNGTFASSAATQGISENANSRNSDAVAGKVIEQSETAAAQNTSAEKNLQVGVSTSRASRNGSGKRAANAEVDKLVQQAIKSRTAVLQYELGMRYAAGRGVPSDKALAYAWLVIALNNGETRSEAALQSLSPRLSTLDVQKIRMTVGDWYAHGRGVEKDLVAAHKWFALAEVAGSAEATVRKKELEAAMSSTQIEQAEENTTAWLSRH
jgi:hypothetical protein